MPPNAHVNPEIHRAACILARRFTAMVAFLLRDEEKGECEREAYRISVEILSEQATFKGK